MWKMPITGFFFFFFDPEKHKGEKWLLCYAVNLVSAAGIQPQCGSFNIHSFNKNISYSWKRKAREKFVIFLLQLSIGFKRAHSTLENFPRIFIQVGWGEISLFCQPEAAPIPVLGLCANTSLHTIL